MNKIILDLEWNGVYTKKTNGYFNEIIEIGAVKMNDRMEMVDTFHAVIKPVVSRRLSTLVQNLTGIEQEELRDGMQFPRAVSQFRKWIDDSSAVIMTWSTTDLMVLLENCRYFLGDEHIPFMRYYADLQAYCQSRLEICAAGRPENQADKSGQQLGLGKACELFGIHEDELSPHRALDDSILSGRVFASVFEPDSFEKAVREADQTFYERLSFKNIIISDINDEHVQHSDLRFLCEGCSRPLHQTSEWQFRSRAFCAEFWCRHCDQKYTARVQVKLKYDGPETKRRLTVKPVEPEAAQEESGDMAQTTGTNGTTGTTESELPHAEADTEKE